VSFATDSEYDDLGHGYVRRPISVAQLLEREGYRPAARSSATRRALTGVAAGAVLALGAVVGSLLLNHGATATTGDTLAAGAVNGGIGQSGNTATVPQSGSTTIGTAAQTQPTTNTGTAATVNTAPKAASSGTQTGTTRSGGTMTPTHTQPQTQQPATQSASAKPVTTPVTPATQSAPTGTTAATTPTTTMAAGTPASTTTTTAPTKTNSGGSSSPGLLGSLTGTLTGTLDAVTQPVFTWFG
jgi:hypothetical protein